MKKNDGFFEKVYSVVRLIPCGKVTSYGAVANYISSPGASRMVGWALNNSHAQKNYVPAHRVVNRNGVLSGKHHFGTENAMRQLLENEGLIIKDDVILNFRKNFWDPSISLDISD